MAASAKLGSNGYIVELTAHQQEVLRSHGREDLVRSATSCSDKFEANRLASTINAALGQFKNSIRIDPTLTPSR